MDQYWEKDASSGQSYIRKLPNPLELLKASWAIYKLRFKTLIGILLIFIFVSLIYYLISLSISVGLIFSVFVIFQTKFSLISILPFLLGLFIFIFLAILEGLPLVALYTAITFYREGIGLKEAFKRAFRKFLKFYWLTVIISFVILGGSILFVIPGIIFLVWFTPASYVLISENIGGFSALIKSREYVRGYFLKVLFYLVVMLIILILQYILTIFLTGIIGQFFKTNMVVKIGITILVMIGNIFIIFPLSSIYSFLIYDNLKAVRGDFAFQPTFGKKRVYILVALAPFLLIILFPLTIFILSKIINPPVFPQNEYDFTVPTNNPLVEISPTPIISPTLTMEEAKLYVSADNSWLIGYDPNIVMLDSGSAEFSGASVSCAIGFRINAVDNSHLINLESYVASNSAYFGSSVKTTIINNIPAYKTEKLSINSQNAVQSSTSAETSPEKTKYVFYVLSANKKIIILSYWTPTTYPSGSLCQKDEDYINSMFQTFQLL